MKIDWKKIAKSNTAFVIYNLLAAVVVALIIVGIVFLWLNRHTEHGKEVEVPQICGMYTEEARINLQQNKLDLQVVDSTYSKKVPLGAIVEQNPPAGAHVKHGRDIYVIINSKANRSVPLPELRDISYRQAEATLKAIGLQVKDIRYEPSEFRDLVLDVRQDGSSVEAGTRLEEGTQLTLVVGKGKGTQQVYVPDLTGKTLSQARRILLGSRLIIGAVNYDEGPSPQDTSYIYQQSPKGGQWLLEGSHINLSLSTDINKRAQNTENEDENFF